MTEFDWNRLRVGDRVIVSEHRVEAHRLRSSGTVAFVNQRPRRNEVGVRVDGDAARRVLWPTRFELQTSPEAMSAP